MRKLFLPSVRRKGLTIVELLVCIAIVAVLVSLLLVGLSATRRSASRTQCLVNMRQCSTAFMGYVADWRDTFPLFASMTESPAFTNAGYELSYAAQSFHWPLALQDYLGDQRLSDAAICPTSSVGVSLKLLGKAELLSPYPETYVFTSTYQYSMNFTTLSSAWAIGGDPDAASVRGPVRSGWVQYPSNKGLLVETTPNHRAKDAPMNSVPTQEDVIAAAFVDGSAEHRLRSRFVPGFRDGSYPVKTTLDGYRGIDRK